MSSQTRPILSPAAATSVIGIALWLSVAAATPASAQKISVKSATPNQGAQETVDLDVVIAGSGFGPGAQAKFVLAGTDNPDGIRVKNTKYVNNTQLVATIDIDATASLALFDIKVTVSGRSGKGTDLFQVIEKVSGQAACVGTQYPGQFTLLGTLNTVGPSGSPLFSGGFGYRVRVAPGTRPDGTTILVAAVGTWFEAQQAHFFFFDPVTLAQVQPPQSRSVAVAGGQFGPHGGMAVGDVDGNGVPDFGMSFGELQTVWVLFGSFDSAGAVAYSAPVRVPAPDAIGRFGSALAIGDLDGLPGDEIVVGHDGGPVTRKVSTVGRLHVFKFVGTMTAPAFALLHSITPSATPAVSTYDGYARSAAIGDVTGDSHPDIVAGGHRKVFVLPGPTFDANPETPAYDPAVIVTPAPTDVPDGFGHMVAAPGDIDGDGTAASDLLASTPAASPASRADLFRGHVLSGQLPATTFTPFGDAGDGSWSDDDLQAVDLNGDGLRDVLISAESGRLAQSCNQIGLAYIFLSVRNPSTGAPAGWQRFTLHAPSFYHDWARFGSIGAAHGYRLLLVGDYNRLVGGVASAGQVFVYRVNEP
jgi:hypothetical protein